MQTPAIMKAAHPRDVRDHHLPVLPDWWPVPPSADDGTAPLTPDERVRARRVRAVQEATQGPVDGMRYKVAYPDGGRPPATFSPGGDRGLRYRLSEAESSPHSLVYRYDMDCPSHQGSMRAVEDAFREVGREYVIAAREEDQDHDRTAPDAAAFAPTTGLAYPRR